MVELVPGTVRGEGPITPGARAAARSGMVAGEFLGARADGGHRMGGVVAADGIGPKAERFGDETHVRRGAADVPGLEAPVTVALGEGGDGHRSVRGDGIEEAGDDGLRAPEHGAHAAQ